MTDDKLREAVDEDKIKEVACRCFGVTMEDFDVRPGWMLGITEFYQEAHDAGAAHAEDRLARIVERCEEDERRYDGLPQLGWDILAMAREGGEQANQTEVRADPASPSGAGPQSAAPDLLALREKIRFLRSKD